MNAALLALMLSGNDATPRSVGRDEILGAMRACEGYDPTATTNGARFQAEVLVHLARRAPDGHPLHIGHAEWFSAFLERTGLAAERSPVFVRLAYEYAQDLDVDYRTDHVVESAEGSRPAFAANVVVSWPEARGAAGSYSYADLLSTPHLQVTNRRVIVYRLLDLGGMTVYGQIEGLQGRPTTGFLGTLFRLIGEGHLKESRMLISRDGLQVSRTRAEKWSFGVTQTVTVHPDGQMEKDVPLERPDLTALAARLEEPLRVRYRPFKPPSS